MRASAKVVCPVDSWRARGKSSPHHEWTWLAFAHEHSLQNARDVGFRAAPCASAWLVPSHLSCYLTHVLPSCPCAPLLRASTYKRDKRNKYVNRSPNRGTSYSLLRIYSVMKPFGYSVKQLSAVLRCFCSNYTATFLCRHKQTLIYRKHS